MIGDVPKGAPFRCRLGRHRGSEPPAGGLSFFTCPDCGGTYHQKKDYSAELAAADRAIDRGDTDLARQIHEGAARRG